MKVSLDRATFLKTYLPLPHSALLESFPSLPEFQDAEKTLPRRILHQLMREGKCDDNGWIGIPKDRDSSIEEEDLRNTFMKIIERIASLTREYLPDTEGIPGKWFYTNKRPLQSWSENEDMYVDLEPAIIFAHDETSSFEEIFWSRTFSAVEVKKRVREKVVAKELEEYVSCIFVEQVDRLFVNAITLNGWELQMYRFDRSGIICMQDSINIHQWPEDFIQVIASFSYLSPADLGWDPTCKIWDSAKKCPRPSYELPQSAFYECGVYDLPWVLEVNGEHFVSIGAVHARRTLSTLGRAAFIVHAVELQDWVNKNREAKVYILKQCWQRLPELRSEPKTAGLRNGDTINADQLDREALLHEFEGIDDKPFEHIVMDRVGWSECIKNSWNVKLGGDPITTFKTVRRNVAVSAPPPSQRSKSPGNPEDDLEWWTSDCEPSEEVPDNTALVTRTLVRLVFDRPGWPIHRFTSKMELLVSLKGIVQELGYLYKRGVIHRDVSPSNLIISECGGHVIDFDHSIIAFEKGEEGKQRTNENVNQIAVDVFGTGRGAKNYIFALQMLWETDGRPTTPADFNWPTKLEAVYLFGDRTKRDNLPTGTYQYLSHHLTYAPFHHCTHDLDSLFWSLNLLPLTFDGPGGKKRQNPAVEIIDKYYENGPHWKMDMYAYLYKGMDQFPHMMSQYSDYFKDLTGFMEKWFGFNSIACGFKNGYEYHSPHNFLIKIIDEAIEGLGPDTEKGYENFADEERERRKKEKDDMAEAISKQMTIPALLKERNSGPVAAANITATSSASRPLPAVVACPRPSTPHATCVPTARSPENGRVVKKSKCDSFEG